MQDSSRCSEVSTTTVTSFFIQAPFSIDLGDFNLVKLSCKSLALVKSCMYFNLNNRPAVIILKE